MIALNHVVGVPFSLPVLPIPITVCPGLVGTWGQVRPEFRHIS